MGLSFPSGWTNGEGLGWRVPGLAAGWAVPRGGHQPRCPFCEWEDQAWKGGWSLGLRTSWETLWAKDSGPGLGCSFSPSAACASLRVRGSWGLGQRCPWGRGREAPRSHLGGEQCPPEDRNGRRREGVKGRAPGSSGSAGGEGGGRGPHAASFSGLAQTSSPFSPGPGQTLKIVFPSPSPIPGLASCLGPQLTPAPPAPHTLSIPLVSCVLMHPSSPPHPCGARPSPPPPALPRHSRMPRTIGTRSGVAPRGTEGPGWSAGARWRGWAPPYCSPSKTDRVRWCGGGHWGHGGPHFSCRPPPTPSPDDRGMHPFLPCPPSPPPSGPAPPGPLGAGGVAGGEARSHPSWGRGRDRRRHLFPLIRGVAVRRHQPCS